MQAATTVAGSEGEGDVSVSLGERARLSGSEADRIRELPGIAAVVADRSVYAPVVDRHGRLLKGANGSPSVGHGWESAVLTPYALSEGGPPARRSDVVIDAHLASERKPAGRRPCAGTDGLRSSDFQRCGDRRHREARGSCRSRQRSSSAPTWPRASRAPAARVDLLGVITRPGFDAARVADAVRDRFRGSGLRVLTGAKRGDAESPEDALSREDIVAGLTVFAVLAAFVAIFVVASTFALSVQQRHRELALFRAIGSTPRQVRQLVAGEALVISVVAVLLSLPLSVLAAYLEKGLFVRAGMIPEGLHIVVGWLPLLAGLVAAVTTTQLAAFASARRASRIRPTDALREATVRRRPVSWLRAVAGLAVLAGGIAFVLLAARHSGGLHESDAPAAAMVLMVAAALLGPLLAWPFASLTGWPLAASGSGPGLLAWANTRANLRRAASVATPLMLADLRRQHDVHRQDDPPQGDARADGESHHGLIRLAGSRRQRASRGSGGGGPAPPRRRRSVRHRLDLRRRCRGRHEPSVFPARGVDIDTLDRVLSLGVVSGSLANLRGDSIAVSRQSASDWGWRIGDRVRLWLGDGTPTTLRVVAEYTRPLGFGEVVMPRRLVQGHVTQPLDDAVFVVGDPEVRAADLERTLQTLRSTTPTVRVVGRSAYEAEIDAAAEKQSLAVYVLLGLIVLFCTLALVNALTMAIGERAREFALLRLIGATKGQVRAMIRTETVIMVAFGLTMGSLIAVPGLALLNHSLTGSLLPSVPLWSYLALLAFYAVVGLAATVFPARWSLRANPVTATAHRE